MATRTFLIVGATGQQGGSVVQALSKLIPTITTSSISTPNKPPSSSSSSSSAPPPPKILALTRSTTSPKAQALISKYPHLDLRVIQGDVQSPAPIFKQHPGITSMFHYTIPPNEEPQAIPLIDGAADAGVGHIVFSSVDRGGDVKSWSNPTKVQHFMQKHNIEQYLQQKAKNRSGDKAGQQQPLEYTILRPTAFLDNFNPTGNRLLNGMFAALWSTMPPATKLQLVSVHDIGVFGAKALLFPDAWAGRAVGLAGEEMTLDEARETYRRVSGGKKELPQSFRFLGKAIRWGVKEVDAMFAFFEREGYGVDIAKLRKEEPGLQDFETWLRESSRFDEIRGK